MTGPSLDRRCFLAASALLASPLSAAVRRPRLVYRDDFRHGLRNWAVEMEKPAQLRVRNGILDIDTPAGLTLWFKPILREPVLISYEVMPVAAGGPNDRVSDVNCFWMATDPDALNGDALARSRSGKFADYDDLKTYYVGLGGNYNSTSRFRRYVGQPGNRPLLPEHDLSGAGDLLVPNQWEHIRLIATGSDIRYERNGRTMFRYIDGAPYREGRFGLRTTFSHLRVRRFAVYRLA
jgi:hypothetical protein